MSPAEFRRIALQLAGAVEGEHMGHPDFRVNGRIFATLYPDGRRGMVKLSPAQQRKIIHDRPDCFEPASGAWGRQGCTTVHLAATGAAVVRGPMKDAWQAASEKPAVRKK